MPPDPAPPPAPPDLGAEYAKKIATARAVAQERRDCALVDIPFLVAGKVELRPMCLPDFLILVAAGNALVTGQQPPSESDLGRFWAGHSSQFMWVLSPEWSRSPAARARFIERVGRLPAAAVYRDLRDYLAETFADAPKPARRTTGTEGQADDPVRVSFAAIWLHQLASRYHWSRAEIRATPLRELWQYLRCIQAEDAYRAGRTPRPPGDEVDALWAEYLAKLNPPAVISP